MDMEDEAKNFMSISLAITKIMDNRTPLVIFLREEADKLNKMEKDVKISEISGSTASITGGVMALVGILGAPFTLGGSLSLTAAGVALGAAGAVTGAGAAIAKSVISKNKRDEINKLLATDTKLMELLEEKLSRASKCFKYAKLITETVNSLTQLIRVGDAAADCAKVLGKFGKTIKVGGAVLTAITIPLDIYTIVSNSVDIHKGTQNELAKEFKQIANKLDNTLKHLSEMKCKLS